MTVQREPLETSVPAAMNGRRLDEVLAALAEGDSRAFLQKLVRRGRVRVNDRKVLRSNGRVSAGDRLLVHFSEPAGNTAPAERALALPVLFADEHLIAVDKPAGMVSHPTERIAGETVSERVTARFGPLPTIFGSERPGIVQRLDRQTSGVMVLGRSEAALRNLKQQFKRRSVEKVYRALVHGVPGSDRFCLDAPLGRASGDRQTVHPVGGGKPARTDVAVRTRFDGFADLVCSPRTGRRHQIRAHLFSVGLQVIGDDLYRVAGRARLPETAPRPRRLALHAAELRLTHPHTGQPLRLTSALPAELERLLVWLREHRSG